MANFIPVPFKIDDNLSQIAGMGKFSSAGIILEYESKLFGIIKNGVKESRFTLEDILDVNFKKGIFKRGAKIEIRLKDFSKLVETPNKDGKIILKIAAADFERAQEAIERINQKMEEKSFARSEKRSPVSHLFEEEEHDE